MEQVQVRDEIVEIGRDEVDAGDRDDQAGDGGNRSAEHAIDDERAADQAIRSSNDAHDADLFAVYGSADLWLAQTGGVACGTGNFHVPFANGRVAYAANNQGTGTGPLTACSAGLAINCGAQSQPILQSNLPAVNWPSNQTIPGITPTQPSPIKAEGLSEPPRAGVQ